MTPCDPVLRVAVTRLSGLLSCRDLDMTQVVAELSGGLDTGAVVRYKVTRNQFMIREIIKEK